MTEEKNQHRQAIVVIAGDRFVADYAADCLRLIANPTRQLPFDRMEGSPFDGYYTFLYDPDVKGIFEIPPGMKKLPEQLLYVEIPNKAFLDPVQLLLQKGYQADKIETAFYTRSATDDVARLMPRVLFHDDQFFVDFRRGAFIDTLDLHNRISFSDAKVPPSGKIFLDYDLNTRQLPDPSKEDFFEDGTLIVVLPPYKEIDPEGWKRLDKPETDTVSEMRELNRTFSQYLHRLLRKAPPADRKQSKQNNPFIRRKQ